MINEKQLLHLMKEAYKYAGIHVSRTDVLGYDAVLLNCGFWCVMIPMQIISGKIIGLICEWLRRMPMIGESFQFRAKEDPDPLSDGDVSGLNMLQSNTITTIPYALKPTRFRIKENRVFQRKNQDLVLIALEHAALIENHINLGYTNVDNSIALWESAETEERVYIAPRRDVSPAEIAHLQKYNFWEERDHE
ncbi:MAG: hypothetical protein RSF73_04975 [Ruthenibacterium sp.]